MDANNVHTSVVIELANQEEPEEQKTYKIDFNEVKTPKDYVIDQIFCGENVTVYALFEIPDLPSKQSENEIMEMQNTTITDEFRFFHKNSFKKTKPNMSNVSKRKVSEDSEDDFDFLQKLENQNRSFHCLKHSCERYEMPSREDNSAELKVLFSKDFMSSASKQATLKAVSIGVNTEITQSPKIIEEVQKAIAINYPGMRSEAKKVEIASMLSGKPSFEIFDTDTQPSFSSFSSGSESRRYRKKSSPNFLFVPLIMMEDKFLNYLWRDRAPPQQQEDKIIEPKTQIIQTKVSFGTNTDVAEFSSVTSETEERREIKSQISSHCVVSKTEKSEIQDIKKEKSSQSILKKKDKNTILNEVKKLQGKLNALIKSIEYNDLYLSANEDEELPGLETKTSEEVTNKTLEEVADPISGEFESFRLNKFDDIPIFSPLTFTPPSRKCNSRKRNQNVDREVKRKFSLESVKSVSSDFVSHQEEISIVKSVRGEEKPKVKLKNVFSGLNIDWDSTEGWRGVGASKSDAHNRCNVPVTKHSCLKKSLSFDMRDDKMETLCLKKMKNSTFKYEGGLKANLRKIQSKEVHLGDNKTPISQKMGDEITRKLVPSKSDILSFKKDPEKENVNASGKNSKTDIKKSQNEEEGDAKLMYPNENLIPQTFVQNPAVHYCSTNTIVSDGLMKNAKSVTQTRVKSKPPVKTDELGPKGSCELEKPTALNKACRKASAVESDVKKEVKPIKKLSARSRTFEKKPERKDVFPFEQVKPRSVAGSRKFSVRGTAESKLHVDKLLKKALENHCKSEIMNPKTVKSTVEHKMTVKTDKIPRPPSQKREIREKTPETGVLGKKETEKKIGKKKSAALVEAETCSKNSLTDLNLKENVNSVMVFENVNETPKEPQNEENSQWLNPSSVVVELFSKKPSSVEELYSDVNQDQSNTENVPNKEAKGNENECENGDSGNQEKPIVKSVWALTKVLLYEDGTKKLEVLEASLTPPGFSLKPSEKKFEAESPN